MRPLDAARARATLDSICARVPGIADACGDRFPLYGDPVSGRWVTTRRGSWTGGFWTGLLWLRARLTGNRRDREYARGWTVRLAGRIENDTATRGMLFDYGAAFGHRIVGDEVAADVAVAARNALSRAYDDDLGFIPEGAALAMPGEIDPRHTTIDSLSGVVGLLSWTATRVDDRSRTSAHRAIALRHASHHAELCVRSDGAVMPATGSTAHWRHGQWSRGQAWAMLGFAEAAQRLSSPACLATARLCADYWLDVVGLRCASWRLDDPGRILDTSASAIAIVALGKLAALNPPRADAYAHASAMTLADLADHHVTGDTALTDGCYNAERGIAPRNELIWGTYFLACALAVGCGLLSLNDI